MKKLGIYIFLSASLGTFAGCDKGFVEKNVNPYALNSIEPAILFTNAQRTTSSGFWEGEQTVVQQFVNSYNLGATAGFNFNEDNNNFNIVRWNDNYPNAVKLLTQIISLTKDNPAKSNLYNMARIWKAYIFMTMVDTYKDVPYTDAGKAYLETNFFPKYDKDQAVYDDLYNELKIASAALDASKEFVREDLLYGTTTSTAANQVTEWKRLGYSLLLRLGMRYSKVDPTKAKNIVVEAYNGGVMQSNSDNAFIKYTSVYNSPLNNSVRVQNPYYYYLAEPFVNKLKATRDPRLQYISGKYADPNQVLALKPDTTMANQFGFPVGYDQNTVRSLAGYRGQNGTGQNYSQLNYSVIGSATAPVFYVTNAQTKLLLAEAAFRGWLTGLAGVQTAQQYYEAGIRASMDEYSLYPNVPTPAVSANLQNSYLADPGVAYNATNALNLINTQYWIVSVANGAEVFANFRRSGFPVLTPNSYNTNLQGGFVRRFPYPNEENARNTQNYLAALASIGGNDNLTTRVFWDTP